MNMWHLNEKNPGKPPGFEFPVLCTSGAFVVVVWLVVYFVFWVAFVLVFDS